MKTMIMALAINLFWLGPSLAHPPDELSAKEIFELAIGDADSFLRGQVEQHVRPEIEQFVELSGQLIQRSTTLEPEMKQKMAQELREMISRMTPYFTTKSSTETFWVIVRQTFVRYKNSSPHLKGVLSMVGMIHEKIKANSSGVALRNMMRSGPSEEAKVFVDLLITIVTKREIEVSTRAEAAWTLDTILDCYEEGSFEVSRDVLKVVEDVQRGHFAARDSIRGIPLMLELSYSVREIVEGERTRAAISARFRRFRR